MKLMEVLRSNPPRISQDIEPWMFHTKDEIENWISTVSSAHAAKSIEFRYKNQSAVVATDLEIVVHGDFSIRLSTRRIMDLDSDVPYPDGDDTSPWHEALYNKHKEKIIPEPVLVRHGSDVLLPVQFKSTESFYLESIPVTSLIGIPKHVHGSLRISDSMIENMHGFPESVRIEAEIDTLKNLDLDGMPDNLSCPVLSISSSGIISNIKSIPKGIKKLRITSVNTLAGIENSGLNELTIRDIGNYPGMINCLKLKTLERIFVIAKNGWASDVDEKSKVYKAAQMINEFLASEDPDIISCKRQMIGAGLKEFV